MELDLLWLTILSISLKDAPSILPMNSQAGALKFSTPTLHARVDVEPPLNLLKKVKNPNMILPSTGGGGTRQLHQTSLIWGQMGLK